MRHIFSGLFIGISALSGFIIKGVMDSNDKLVVEVRIEGRAEENIKADLFEWSFSYQTVGDSIQEVKAAAKKAKAEIISMISENGLVKDKDFMVKPKQLKNSKTDDGKNVFVISQEYEVKTEKMQEAQKAYKSSELLVDKGISITMQNTDVYKVKDKTSLEKQLLKKALDDSKVKAERVAEITGGKIISLPATSWSYIRFKDANTSDDSINNGASINQIAVIEISTTYKMKRK